MPELNIESLDVQDAEILNEPAPAPESVPVVEVVERVRDPATGRFQPQAPASMPDPTREPSAVIEEPAPAAPAQSAPQPAQQPTPEPVEQPRQIPLAAHLEERRRFQQEISQRDQRLNEIQTRLQALEKPAAPEPDFIEDPKAYIDSKLSQEHKEIEALRNEAAQLQQAQQFTAFTQEVGNREAAFIEKTPDYYDALTHVRTMRSQELAYLYPGATTEQITQTIRQEELTAAAQLLQMGRDPAESVYALAKTRGYRAAAPAAPAPLVRPAVPKAPVADPGSTLGSSGGSAETDVENLADDGDESAEAIAKLATAERFSRRR